MSAPPLQSNASQSTQANPWELFGLDLRTIGQDWLHAMRQLHRVPPLRWFELNPRVHLLRADSSTAYWQGARLRPHSDGDAQAAFYAVELPENLLLRRQLSLPDLPAAQVRDAVALDIFSSSPFAQDDIAWGYVQTPGEAGTQIAAAFASRAQIAQHLTQLQQQGWPVEQSEVWVFAPTDAHGSAAGEPIVLQGYAEGLAEQARGRRRRKALASLAVGAALLGALALTPTLQLRSKALQADAAYNQLRAQTERLSHERATLASALESVVQIRQSQDTRVNLAQLLQFLSDLLPDDVSLHSLDYENPKPDAESEAPARQTLRMMGEADNAAAVIQLLSDQEAFSDVRTTQPVQQVPNADKERFTVQMNIVAGAFNTGYSAEALPEAPEAPASQEPEAPPQEPQQPPQTPPEQAQQPPAQGAAEKPAEQPAQAQPPAAQTPAPAPTARRRQADERGGVTPMTPPQLTPSTLPGQGPAAAPAPQAEQQPTEQDLPDSDLPDEATQDPAEEEDEQ